MLLALSYPTHIMGFLINDYWEASLVVQVREALRPSEERSTQNGMASRKGKGDTGLPLQKKRPP